MKAGTKVEVTLGIHKGEWTIASQKRGKRGQEAGMVPVKVEGGEIVLLPARIVKEIKN
jgi:hypothetical protein